MKLCLKCCAGHKVAGTSKATETVGTAWQEGLTCSYCTVPITAGGSHLSRLSFTTTSLSSQRKRYFQKKDATYTLSMQETAGLSPKPLTSPVGTLQD